MNWLRNWKKVRTNMLPNWYGIPGIGFEWRGSQSDPMLHYKGHTFNYWDIEYTLWEHYNERENIFNEDEWEQYVKDNAINYLDDVIAFIMRG